MLLFVLALACVCSRAPGDDTLHWKTMIETRTIALEPAPDGTVDLSRALDDAPGPDFGHTGSTRLTLALGAASDFESAEDAFAFIQWSRFVSDEFEWAFELGGWALDRPGEYTPGVSVGTIFRYHFLQHDDWSMFADVGIGVLLSSGEVPTGGTNVNFLPRIGVGGTYRINNSRTRLIGGVRWHHISNAKILGNDENPSRDGLMLYLGVSIPF